jgi:predicted  nucleic acid-binding Zn-ribbon protein
MNPTQVWTMPTTRHRIPSIFNLSMVDVLCCALGCVILLWLLNLRQARQSGNELTRTQIALASQTDDAERYYRDLSAVEDERNNLRFALAGAKADLARLNNDLQSLRDKRFALEKLTEKQAKELAAALARGEDLESLLKTKEKQAQTTARTVRDLEGKLRDADARTARLEKDLDARGGDLVKARKSLDDTDTLRLKLTRDLAARDTELAGTKLALEKVREEKSSLMRQASRLKGEMESRFAGIALTGRNVVFLVDMSGSMELVDPRTADPNKWSGVRETLAKVMKSLPGLEKYQVILFSDKVLYPLGGEGEWFDYEGGASVNQVLKTLGDPKYKPKGGTNMYSAFEAAFRLRATGLDTIYLFSDGLPNQGRGMTAEQAATLGEIEKGEILGKYIRKTLTADWNRGTDTRPRVRINAIGFFYESPDVGAFLWALARENDGSFVGMSKP